MYDTRFIHFTENKLEMFAAIHSIPWRVLVCVWCHNSGKHINVSLSATVVSGVRPDFMIPRALKSEMKPALYTYL